MDATNFQSSEERRVTGASGYGNVALLATDALSVSQILPVFDVGLLRNMLTPVASQRGVEVVSVSISSNLERSARVMKLWSASRSDI